ncbi:MAG: hypothetical protein M1824_006554 [Vezdaea acicularis]|nr:MAG: hypothetical protein M1824_006554 [Vezdaea acicularis]
MTSANPPQPDLPPTTAASTNAPSTHTNPSTTPTPTTHPLPGPRALALQKIYNEALAHTLKTCSYANFSSCFPTPAKYVPDSLHKLWAQMVGRLEELAKSEFADILAEREVVPRLNELDELVAEARRRRDREPQGEGEVAPHMLPPHALLAAHLGPYLAQQQSQLNAQLQTTASKNAALLQEIRGQREEIDGLVKQLEGVVHDLEGAEEALAKGLVGERGAEGVREEVRSVEGELGTR